MIGAFFIACMIANPAVCTESFTPLYDATPFQCAYTAQIMLAEHLRDHPGYFVQRYGCRRVDAQSS